MPNAARYFAASYAEAREGFLAAARSHGIGVESALHPTHKGAQGEDLAIDAAVIGVADAPTLLIITSGTHGVEGFCGSGCQRALLDDADMLRRIEAGKAAVLLVHAVNPYGFSHLRRVNEDNVDLNRNFVDFGVARDANEAYAQVHDLLVPQEWPPTERNRADIAACAARMGMAAFQALVSAGQGVRANGLFYCGTQPTWSNRTLRAILRRHGAARKRIGWIDLHTGLGPCGHGEKIYGGADDAGELARARAWYGADVMSYYDGKSASAEVRGSMVMCVYAECTQAQTTSMGLEFGTLPFEAVLGALRGDHWLDAHPQAGDELRGGIKRMLRDAFYIDTDDWKGMVLGQARTATLQAVTALSAR